MKSSKVVSKSNYEDFIYLTVLHFFQLTNEGTQLPTLMFPQEFSRVYFPLLILSISWIEIFFLKHN